MHIIAFLLKTHWKERNLKDCVFHHCGNMNISLIQKEAKFFVWIYNYSNHHTTVSFQKELTQLHVSFDLNIRCFYRKEIAKKQMLKTNKKKIWKVTLKFWKRNWKTARIVRFLLLYFLWYLLFLSKPVFGTNRPYLSFENRDALWFIGYL